MEEYRNRKEITSYEGETIEAESLWTRKGELMILVDEDRYITSIFDDRKYYKVNR